MTTPTEREHRYIYPFNGPAYCTGCDWESRQIGISSDTQHQQHVEDMDGGAA